MSRSVGKGKGGDKGRIQGKGETRSGERNEEELGRCRGRGLGEEGLVVEEICPAGDSFTDKVTSRGLCVSANLRVSKFGARVFFSFFSYNIYRQAFFPQCLKTRFFSSIMSHSRGIYEHLSFRSNVIARSSLAVLLFTASFPGFPIFVMPKYLSFSFSNNLFLFPSLSIIISPAPFPSIYFMVSTNY